MSAQLRDYACECPRRSCRTRLYMTPGTYAQLADLGRVVSIDHADQAALRSFPRYGYCVVPETTKRVAA